MPECKCICGKVFNTEKGLKIHRSKKGCPTAPEQRAVSDKQTDKTSNNTRPEDNHSPECVSVSGLQWIPPKLKIKFPSSREKKAWQELDKVLGQGLTKRMKKETSVKVFTDFIYQTSLEKFGSRPSKLPSEPKPSRRQKELATLRNEKKVLRRRWREADESERDGLSVLWNDVKRRVSDLRRAEKARRKKYERRRARQQFFKDPYRFGKSLLDPPKSGVLEVDQPELEGHLSRTYSDDLRSVLLGERHDIPVVPLPTNSFNLAAPSYEEIRGVVRKARNKSAPGPNGVPYLLYKRCPRTLKMLHTLVKSAWEEGRVDEEWKRAEGVYIPKEKGSRSLAQFRPISLLNVEGKVFFTIMASRLTQYVMSNQYIDTTVQKGGVPGVPGCIEHTTMIWESIQQAKKNHLSLYVVWLDLANAYGSVPHQLLWKTLEDHHIPKPVITILQDYFRGFVMRFSTTAYTTKWIPLQVGIAMGCAISPCLFVLAMQILLNAAGSLSARSQIGRRFYTSSIKAFMDDTTLVMNRKQTVQKSLDKLNELLEWCRMSFKPAKSRSLALTRGKIRSDVFFTVAGQRIPTVEEESVKSLGRVFDETLKDKNQEAAVWRMVRESLEVIGAVPLPGRFKVWLIQFVLLPRLLWPLTIYEIGLPTVEALERCINRLTRKWLGLPPGLSSVALYSRSAKLKLPFKSIVEEFRISKIRTQLMINNSTDTTIREVRPLLRTGRKFNAQAEIGKSQEVLTFEEIRGPIQVDRHGVGWNHFSRWSQASAFQKSALVIQERRKEIESSRITKAVQQGQQGQWTTWNEALQRTLTWSDLWSMPPLRLAFVIRALYDQLPSRDNLRRWGLVEDVKCALCGEVQTLRHILSSCRYALAQGRYTWRHNQVLEVVVRAMEEACSKANAREYVPQRRMYFLREGASEYASSKCKTPRRNLLENANDWVTAADLEGKRHYPQVIQESGRRPDAVLTSTKTDTIILVELTVPWEDRMEHSNVLKEEKYSELTMDLIDRGYKAHFFAIEVGARGLVGRSSLTFLREIGLPNKERSKTLRRMSEAAETASHWLWSKKDSQ